MGSHRQPLRVEQLASRNGWECRRTGDEADEAFGGIRPPGVRRRGWRCRLMPAPARNRGHRLAAYRQCWADLGGAGERPRASVSRDASPESSLVQEDGQRRGSAGSRAIMRAGVEHRVGIARRS
jgi:hypothetical protein